MIVTVYSKDDCQGCKATAKKLDQKNIPFEYVQVDANPEAKAKADTYGYVAAPVVVVDLGDGAEWTWSGYQPTQIDELVSLMAA